MCNFLWKLCMFSGDLFVHSLAFRMYWAGREQINSSGGLFFLYFQCNRNGCSLYYSQFGRFAVGCKCLVWWCWCFCLFLPSHFHCQREQANRRISQSNEPTHHTQPSQKYHVSEQKYVLALIELHSTGLQVEKTQACLHKMTIPIKVILDINALCAWAHTLAMPEPAKKTRIRVWFN